MAEAGREPEECPYRHEGRKGDGPGQEGSLENEYPARGGRFVKAAADGPHRSVSGPRGRSGNAVGGNAGSLCATDQGRKSTGDRSVELLRGRSPHGLAGQQAARGSRLPESSAFVQPVRSCRV